LRKADFRASRNQTLKVFDYAEPPWLGKQAVEKDFQQPVNRYARY